MDTDKQLYKKIGMRIRVQRRKRKLTQDKLADRVGLTRTSITNIENGSQKIQIHNLYSIAQLFNIPVHQLLPEVKLKNDDIRNALPSELKPKERKWILDLIDQRREGKQYESKKKNRDTKPSKGITP